MARLLEKGPSFAINAFWYTDLKSFVDSASFAFVFGF